MIYIVTGKLGAGKSLVTVQRMIDYAAEGLKIAANFPVDFGPICMKDDSKLAATSVTVLSPIPTSSQLHALGKGGPFEDKAGLLVLDECAQFLNSRTWQGEDRQNMINWLLHARKLCWDVILVVQHERMLDKQVRDALAEYLVVVKRTDRLKIPFMPIPMPRFHVGTVRYGLEPNAMVADRWITRGDLPMQCYNTSEIFDGDQPAYTKLSHATLKRWYPNEYPSKTNPFEFIRLTPKILLYALVRLISPGSVHLLYSKPIKSPVAVPVPAFTHPASDYPHSYDSPTMH